MRKAIIAATLISLLIVVGCSTHIHTVGSGPQSYEIVEARQWYILFGLVPLNTVDTKTMAAGATDYEIKTEQSPLDILMNIFYRSNFYLFQNCNCHKIIDIFGRPALLI